MHWIMWAVALVLILGSIVVAVVELHLRKTMRSADGASIGLLGFFSMTRDGKYSRIKRVTVPVLPVSSPVPEKEDAVEARVVTPGVLTRRAPTGHESNIKINIDYSVDVMAPYPVNDPPYAYEHPYSARDDEQYGND